MELSIIVAMTFDRVIGKNGELPWRISEDLKRFKSLTLNHTVIMGRKTFDSLLLKPLPNRNNIVLTNQLIKIEGVDSCNSLDEAFNIAKNHNKQIFVIGGESIYKQTLPLAQTLFISHVYGKYEGDSYFPEIDYNDWYITKEIPFEDFLFRRYIRR